MKLLFITVFAVLGVSVCPGQTLADILNSQYDDNPIPTVPVEYTLPRLAAKAPFVQLSIRFCWRPGTACSILMNMRRTNTF